MEVVAEANSGEEAYRLHGMHEIDVIVMDLSLPGIGGIETIKRIRSRDNKVKILVFSMHEPSAILRAVTGDKIGTLVN